MKRRQTVELRRALRLYVNARRSLEEARHKVGTLSFRLRVAMMEISREANDDPLKQYLGDVANYLGQQGEIEYAAGTSATVRARHLAELMGIKT